MIQLTQKTLKYMPRPRLRRPPSPVLGDDPPTHNRVTGLDDDDLPQRTHAMVCMWPDGRMESLVSTPITHVQRVVERRGRRYRLYLVDPSGSLNVRAGARFDLDLHGPVIVQKLP